MQASKLLCCVNIFHQTIGSLAAHRLYRHSPMITIVTDTFRRIQSGCISDKNTPRNQQIHTRGEYNSIGALTKKKPGTGKQRGSVAAVQQLAGRAVGVRVRAAPHPVVQLRLKSPQ